MRKGKICFFVPYYPLIKGGAEYQSKIIATALKTSGFEVVYISYGHETARCIDDDGFKVYQLKVVPTIGEKIFLYKRFMKKVRSILLDESPDIIYQRILNTFTYRLSKFLKRSSIPFILHIADNYSVEFDTGKKSFLKKKVLQEILKTSPTIICQTQYQKDKIEEFGYTATAVIPNMHPIITDKVPEKNSMAIVWIGNARPVKQLEVYLQLAALFSESDYQFHIIGKVPDSHYGKQLLGAIRSARNITYHGSQENDFVNAFLMQAGLLVNTSVSEGFSNTFIQAWMCGTPVLALNSDPDGLLEIHDIGLNCHADKSLLFSGVNKILEPRNYGDMCRNALATANALFATEKNIPKFLTVLEKAKNDRESTRRKA